LGVAGRSSMKLMRRPELRKASSRRRWEMRSATKTVVSRKISASGLKLMSVPVPVALPMTSSFLVV